MKNDALQEENDIENQRVTEIPIEQNTVSYDGIYKYQSGSAFALLRFYNDGTVVYAYLADDMAKSAKLEKGNTDYDEGSFTVNDYGWIRFTVGNLGFEGNSGSDGLYLSAYDKKGRIWRYSSAKFVLEAFDK